MSTHDPLMKIQDCHHLPEFLHHGAFFSIYSTYSQEHQKTYPSKPSLCLYPSQNYHLQTKFRILLLLLLFLSYHFLSLCTPHATVLFADYHDKVDQNSTRFNVAWGGSHNALEGGWFDKLYKILNLLIIGVIRVRNCVNVLVNFLGWSFVSNLLINLGLSICTTNAPLITRCQKETG